MGAENACRYELTTRPHDSHQYSYTGMFHRQDDSSIVTYVAKNAAKETYETVGVDGAGLGIAPVSAEYGDRGYLGRPSESLRYAQPDILPLTLG